MLVLILAVTVAAALTFAEAAGPVRYLAAPVDHALTAILGSVTRVVDAALPGGTVGTLLTTSIAVVLPGVLAAAFAAAATATMTVRRAILVVCLVLTVTAYLWMPNGQATIAAAVIGLLAFLVGFGTRWLVVAPLALLAAVLAFRTLLAHVGGTAPAFVPSSYLSLPGSSGGWADLAAVVVAGILAAVPFVYAGRWLWKAR